MFWFSSRLRIVSSDVMQVKARVLSSITLMVPLEETLATPSLLKVATKARLVPATICFISSVKMAILLSPFQSYALMYPWRDSNSRTQLRRLALYPPELQGLFLNDTP